MLKMRLFPTTRVPAGMYSGLCQTRGSRDNKGSLTAHSLCIVCSVGRYGCSTQRCCDFLTWLTPWMMVLGLELAVVLELDFSCWPSADPSPSRGKPTAPALYCWKSWKSTSLASPRAACVRGSSSEENGKRWTGSAHGTRTRIQSVVPCNENKPPRTHKRIYPAYQDQSVKTHYTKQNRLIYLF